MAKPTKIKIKLVSEAGTGYSTPPLRIPEQ
jgi:hypothetical protein